MEQEIIEKKKREILKNIRTGVSFNKLATVE